MVLFVFIWEILVGGYLAKWVSDFLEKDAYEREKREMELRALEAQLPPKPEKFGWFFNRKPPEPKPKTRKQLVADAEALLSEELHFAGKIRDDVARQASEMAAQIRFQRRVAEISEANP